METQITVAAFEALKKRRDAVMLERAKEEARLESLNREIDSLKEMLKEYNITNDAEAREQLEKLSNEVAVEMHTLEESMRLYEVSKGGTDDV